MLKLSQIEACSISNCGLRVLHYNGFYDLEINFKHSDVVIPKEYDLIDVLIEFCEYASKTCSFETCYCGLEPVSDKETRFFTNKERGPLSL
jgi:hypothetical protein